MSVFVSKGAAPRVQDVRAAALLEWQLFWRRRRLRGATLLAALPVLLSLLIVLLKRVDWEWLAPVLPRSADILPMFFNVAYLRVLVVVLPLLLSASLVSREVEAGTLAYLLVRPVSRGSLLLGKSLGAWLIGGVLLVCSFLLSALLLLGADNFADAAEPLRQLPAYTAALATGCLAYGALFTLVGLATRRPGLVGLFLAFFWESVTPYMPGLVRNFTVRHHLIALLPDTGLPLGVLGTTSVSSIPTALLWLAGGSLLAFACSAWLFAERDYP